MATVTQILQGFSMGTSQGNLAFCGVSLIEGSKRILVDVAHNGRRALLVQKLAERGLAPDDIDAVFLTHAHWDHMLNIDLFPNATVLMNDVERQYIKNIDAHDWATAKYTSSIIESMQAQSLRAGEEVDDGVTMLAVPGHSRGSAALLVRSTDGTTSAVCGDAFPNTSSITSGMPRLVFGDPDAARRSIATLMERATTFYPGHDRAFRVHDGGKFTYLEKTSVHLFGFPERDDTEGGAGVSFGYEPQSGPQIVTPVK
jgi:glyoxylase-like metal-dependent hydrolase (beta-lactamase superfamily II)